MCSRATGDDGESESERFEMTHGECFCMKLLEVKQQCDHFFNYTHTQPVEHG